eukprot:scaffold34214_cov63-Phaeocystis_antarctica.AAC.3
MSFSRLLVVSGRVEARPLQSRGVLGALAGVRSGSPGGPVAWWPRGTEATFRTGSSTQWPSQRAACGRRACTEAMRTPPAHHIREVQR